MAALGDELYIALGGKQRVGLVRYEDEVGNEDNYSPAIYDVYRRKVTSLRESLIPHSHVRALVPDTETAYIPVKNDLNPLFYSIGIPKVVEENWDLLPVVVGAHRNDHNSRILAASLVRVLAQGIIIKDGTYGIKGDYRQMSPEGFSIELTELRKEERRTA